MKTKCPDRADVARCLSDLEKLFGKRSPENEIAAGKSGEVGLLKKLREQNITVSQPAQGGAS